MTLLPRTTVATLMLLVPLAASAGALYGTVRTNGGPLGGARLLVACPSFAAKQAAAEAQSDGSGSFALRVNANGKCQMRVERGNQAGPNFDVFFSDKPLRLDFVVDGALARTS